MQPLFAKNWLDSDKARWRIVNDDVMGGRSQSKAFWVNDENIIRFEGTLSLKNNGGFASIRSRVEPRYFSDAEKICIDIKGDGREYQFRLRNSRRFDGYAYVTKFQTDLGVWQNFCFSPNNFTAQYRGRILTHIPPPEFKDIEQLGFMVADKNESDFRLDIRSINSDKTSGTDYQTDEKI